MAGSSLRERSSKEDSTRSIDKSRRHHKRKSNKERNNGYIKLKDERCNDDRMRNEWFREERSRNNKKRDDKRNYDEEVPSKRRKMEVRERKYDNAENPNKNRDRDMLRERSIEAEGNKENIKERRMLRDSRNQTPEKCESGDSLVVRSITPIDDYNSDIDSDIELTKDTLPPYFPAIQGCRSVEEFQCLNRIEEGSYGVVYRAQDKHTQEIVALKRLKTENAKDGFPITSLREINTLLKAQHPNIVTMREVVVGNDMDKIFIVMDYMEHDLKNLTDTMKHKKQIFLPAEVKCLMQQLLRAVAHLHDNWILHRDLKTSNLLLNHEGILKVGDFGMAREYGSPLKTYTSVVVTLWYRAPELLLSAKKYSTPVDMWSVGCIFAEMLAMEPLFPGRSEADQLNKIFKGLGTPNERIWPGYSKLPVVQKANFPKFPISQIRTRFPMQTDCGRDLLNRFLTYNPAQRVTAEEALKHKYFTEAPTPEYCKATASSRLPLGDQGYKQLGNLNEGFHMGNGRDQDTAAYGLQLMKQLLKVMTHLYDYWILHGNLIKPAAEPQDCSQV